MNQAQGAETSLHRARWLLAAGVGVLLIPCLYGAYFYPTRFLQSYLFAFVYWVGVPVGALFFVMVHNLVGGNWGKALARSMSASVSTWWVLALLSIPLLLGVSEIYRWTHVELGGKVVDKSRYLNIPFFTIRHLVYFLVWGILSHVLLKGTSMRKDASARTKALSAGGLVALFLTTSFAGVDWIMSLEPKWFSQIFGMIYSASLILTGLTFCLTALGILSPETTRDLPGRRRTHDNAHVLDIKTKRDLGSLLFVAVMAWAYVGFSQLLIIWSGNTAHLIPWYIHRARGGWELVAFFLIAFHFAIPIFVLLMRSARSNLRRLGSIAGLVLAVHVVDAFWHVIPSFHKEAFYLGWLTVLLPVTMGGIVVLAFLHYWVVESDGRAKRRTQRGVA